MLDLGNKVHLKGLRMRTLYVIFIELVETFLDSLNALLSLVLKPAFAEILAPNAVPPLTAVSFVVQ